MDTELLRLAGDRAIDVALLPINGRRPERRVPGNFWGDEAVRFAAAVRAGVVVPMHYEMFAFNTQTPELFETTAHELGQPHRVLRCGERLDVPADPPVPLRRPRRPDRFGPRPQRSPAHPVERQRDTAPLRRPPERTTTP